MNEFFHYKGVHVIPYWFSGAMPQIVWGYLDLYWLGKDAWEPIFLI